MQKIIFHWWKNSKIPKVPSSADIGLPHFDGHGKEEEGGEDAGSRPLWRREARVHRVDAVAVVDILKSKKRQAEIQA